MDQMRRKNGFAILTWKKYTKIEKTILKCEFKKLPSVSPIDYWIIYESLTIKTLYTSVINPKFVIRRCLSNLDLTFVKKVRSFFRV